MDDPEPPGGSPAVDTDAGPVRAGDAVLGAAVLTAFAASAAATGCARLGARVGVSASRSGFRTARAAARWVPAPIADPVRQRAGSLLRRAGLQGQVVRELAPVALADLVRLVLDLAVPRAVQSALDRLDLTALIAERVDLDALVATVDLDAAVARVDLDAAVARVDVDAVASRVDLDAAVERVDLDAAVARVDVDAVVRAVDLAVVAAIAKEVIAEIDLPLIIRESSGGVAADLVTDVRLQTLDADQAVSRFLDRVFHRGHTSPGPTGPA